MLVFAIDVEYGFPGEFLCAQLLGGQVGQVGDDLLSVQQRVEEAA